MGKSIQFWGSQLPKIRITSKKERNKSCSALNFVQKSPRGHLSIYPHPYGAKRLERVIWLKYCDVQNW